MNSKSWMPGAAWLIVLAFILFAIKASLGCGYDYVSSCATTLEIEVDGTVSGFQASTCSYLSLFNNHDFGPVNSLSITHLKSTTWESCNYTVMNARLHYRIYEQGTTPGDFICRATSTGTSLQLPSQWGESVPPS